MIIRPEQFLTASLSSLPRANDICEILASALNSVDAGVCLKQKVSLDGDYLLISDTQYDLQHYKHIYVTGAGKAAVPMAIALYEILGTRISSSIVITKDGYLPAIDQGITGNRGQFFEAGHPVPDQRNLEYTSQMVSLIKKLAADDLVINLISGGGSSLLILPSPGLSLKDIQETTITLLSCGATIGEINTVRKHLDGLKGGGFTKIAFPASIVSLILSDVVGDNLDQIASGPTVADPTTFQDSWSIFSRYQIIDQIPPRVRDHISSGMLGKISETIKPGNPILDKVQNLLIGNNTQAIEAAAYSARALGFFTEILTTSLQGEASRMGQTLCSKARTLIAPHIASKLPICLIAGGETTVMVKGSGKGGRNQELILGAVKNLSGDIPMLLISLATDGGDGLTDAAGAVATNRTYSQGLAIGLAPQEFLDRNDSYHYFEALGDLIKIGPTMTNVNDLVFAFAV